MFIEFRNEIFFVSVAAECNSIHTLDIVGPRVRRRGSNDGSLVIETRKEGRPGGKIAAVHVASRQQELGQ